MRRFMFAIVLFVSGISGAYAQVAAPTPSDTQLDQLRIQEAMNAARAAQSSLVELAARYDQVLAQAAALRAENAYWKEWADGDMKKSVPNKDAPK